MKRKPPTTTRRQLAKADRLVDVLTRVAPILESEDPASDLYRDVCALRDRLTGGSLFLYFATLKYGPDQFEALHTSAVGAIDILRDGWTHYQRDTLSAPAFENVKRAIKIRPIHIGRMYRNRLPS
jgi:hypothetical protein